MAQLITVTVEKRENTVYSPAVSMFIDPAQIKFVQAEDTDVFNDRALIQYYDEQSKIIVPYVTTESVDDIRVLANAAATDPILYYKVVSTFNRRLLAKLVLLNNISGVVEVEPFTTDPATAFYNFGERNHMANYELVYCSYPLTVSSVDTSENTITVGCCVDNFLVYDTSISVGGSPFTVISVTCTSDGGVILVVEDVSGVNEGDEVELT